MRNPQECSHYWKIQGQKGYRWMDNHAMAQCVHCMSYTVVGIKEGIGPCAHVVGSPQEVPGGGYVKSPYLEGLTRCDEHNCNYYIDEGCQYCHAEDSL